MNEASRLTTVAGPENFVVTLWSKNRAHDDGQAIYLPIDREAAIDLVASINKWLSSPVLAESR
jgi:hypothetical protein